jgi:predicted AAA+ superfamily ATPase
LQQSLEVASVVALLGSRQTGKTTLAKLAQDWQKPWIYLDLELDSDRAALANAQLFLQQHQNELVIIDEIQRQPELFPLLRALVDQHRIPGRFLLLGSASPVLIRQSSDSLAGRIRYLELSPLHLGEVSPDDWQRLWLRGGYPESFLAATDPISLRWRQDYLSTFLERDIPALGIRIPANQLRRCWTMLAHQQSQIWNAAAYATSLGLSGPTVKHYLDTLADTFMVRSLTPYFTNVGKRLVKSPKVYIRDSGLVHCLLGIQSLDQLLAHPVAGHSWEAFCIENIVRVLPADWQFHYYRTSAGAELDLVIESPRGGRYGFEIKLAMSPKLTKGFHNASDDLNTTHNFVIHPGEHRVPLNDRTELLPLGRLMSEVLPSLFG